MEVLPEEVALKYGYRADQKVVNVVALERHTAKIAQVSVTTPTEGGRISGGLIGNYLRIHDNTHYNLDVERARAGKLLESERDIRRVGGSSDLGRFSTLLPSTDRLVVYARNHAHAGLGEGPARQPRRHQPVQR